MIALEAIAEQKAGIIKQGIPLVTGHIAQKPWLLLTRLQGKKATRLVYGERLSGSHHESVVTGGILTIQVLLDKVASRQDCLGLHQIENAGMALAFVR